MTITELAKQLGVSKGTVYNKLKAAGIDIATLRDSSGNDLSNTGIQTISAMFDSVMPSPEPEQNQSKAGAEILYMDRDLIHTLELDNAVLKERISALERENEILRSMIDDWKEQAKTSTRLLTGYVDQPNFLKRIFSRKKKNEL